MAVKTNRGGKYAPAAAADTSETGHAPDEMIDLMVRSEVINGKKFYILKYADTGKPVKYAPKWRNDKSPVKWGRKHHFNVLDT
jgi:hypothetical protein